MGTKLKAGENTLSSINPFCGSQLMVVHRVKAMNTENIGQRELFMHARVQKHMIYILIMGSFMLTCFGHAPDSSASLFHFSDRAGQ